LFGILSSGETKQAIFGRSPITGSDAYEDVLKKCKAKLFVIDWPVNRHLAKYI